MFLLGCSLSLTDIFLVHFSLISCCNSLFSEATVLVFSNIHIFHLLQGHKLRVILWSIFAAFLLISGFVVALLGSFCSITLLWNHQILPCYHRHHIHKSFRSSFVQTIVYVELYVCHSRSIGFLLNHSFLHCKFDISVLLSFQNPEW